MAKFNENLNMVMQMKGVSVTSLSGITGIGKSSISQYCSGKNTPSVQRMEVIAEALGVTKDDLIGNVSEQDTETHAAVNQQVYNLNPKKAAKLLGVGYDFIYQGLRNGIFPWGYAVKNQGSSVWTYFINSAKFSEHEGIKV